MGFKKKEAEELLVKTGHSCCICGHLRVQVHHIIPKEEGGSDDIDNAIPLCPNCHEEVHSSAPPPRYANLCDWLIEDLMNRLSHTNLEDARDGETLSVRVGFKWNPSKAPLDFGDIAWLEVLEVDEYDKIYPKQD